MVFYTDGYRGNRPGVYISITNPGVNEGSPVVTPGKPPAVEVNLFVTPEGLLYSDGPAFSLGSDEVVVFNSVIRPTVQGETLAARNTSA